MADRDPQEQDHEQDTSYTIPARADGFTPVFDVVVRELGATAGLVYGVVWRHCQMRDGYCYAYQKNLAKLAGLGVRSVNRWIGRLIDAGYIRDITPPGTKGDRHHYICTGKVTLQWRAEATAEPDTHAPEAQPQEPNLRQSGVGVRQSGVGGTPERRTMKILVGYHLRKPKRDHLLLLLSKAPHEVQTPRLADLLKKKKTLLFQN